MAPYQESGLWKVDVIMKDLGNPALEAVVMVLELIFQLSSLLGFKHVIQHVVLRSSSDDTRLPLWFLIYIIHRQNCFYP